MPDEALLAPSPIDEQARFGPEFVLPIHEEMPPEPDPYADVETDLDPRVRQDFVGLTYLGRLEEECTVAGHRFLLCTPSQDDRLEMGPLHKPYLNTISTEFAWQLIKVAAFLQRIDSSPAPEPLSPGVSGLRTRWEWVKDSIHSDKVIGLLYQKCLLLEAKVEDVIAELDRLGEPSA